MIGITPTSKAGFFDAIVNERYLEFGHEGIRRYDLLRWNMLATKLADTKVKLNQIRDATGPYTYVPDSIWYKNVGEEIQFYAGTNIAPTAQPFWRPKQRPSPTTGWTGVQWRSHLVFGTDAQGRPTGARIDNLSLADGLARFFVTGKSELYPFHQNVISSYQGLLLQNPGY